MRRPALQLSSVLVLVGALAAVLAFAGCATYRQDLERARNHYEKNEYEPALALFRVLELDLDSLNDGELAQYAYSRGMTDYRLASLVTTASSVADPKQAYRSHARHWLAFAHAVEDKTPGGLTGDEKQRLDEVLTELNRDVYGGGEVSKEGATTSDPRPKPRSPAEAAPQGKPAAGAAKPEK